MLACATNTNSAISVTAGSRLSATAAVVTQHTITYPIAVPGPRVIITIIITATAIAVGRVVPLSVTEGFARRQ